MYPVSESYKQAIWEDTRRCYIEGQITFPDKRTIKFSNEDIMKNSLYIENQCVNGSEITLGAVYAAEFGVTLFTNIDRYSLYDATIEATFYLLLDNGTHEAVPLGIYTISGTERGYSSVQITAYDNMLKFDKTMAEGTIGSPWDMITYCCKKCKVELGMRKEEIEAMTNGTAQMSIYSENDIETYRDLLFYIGQVLCAFATIGRDGKLYFKQFDTDATDTIPHQHRFGTTFSDFVTRYTAISSTNRKTEIAEYYALGVDDGLTMNLGVNPLIQNGLKETREKILNNILQQVAKIKYVPFETSYSGNPAFDLGDVIRFNGGHADATEKSCITHINFRYHQKSNLKCVGKNPRLADAKSKSDKNISGLLSSVKDAELSVFNFTNAKDIRVGNEDIEIINIELASTRQTNAEFKGAVLLSITLTEENTTALLTVKYYINDSFVTDFIPMQTVIAGKYILNLYYPLESIQENTKNSFVAFLNVVGGTATIGQGQIKAAIVGQGFAAGKTLWDGTIKVSENFASLNFNDNFSIVSFTDNVQIEMQSPPQTDFIDNFSSLTFNDEFSIAGFIENLQVSNIIKDQVVLIDNLKNSYLTLYEGLRMRKEYVFTSTEQAIDAGRMSVVEIKPNNMAQIIGIETAENSSESISQITVDLDELKNKYLKNESGLKYQEYFNFTSTEKTIDTGRMSELTIQTDDIKEVTGIEVNR